MTEIKSRNLAACRECGTQVSRSATTCPKCGRQFKQRETAGSLLTFALKAIVAIPLVCLIAICARPWILMWAEPPVPSPPVAEATRPVPAPPAVVAAPQTPAVLPLEKRQAIYQLYCIRSDIAFRAWLEAQPPGDRADWNAKTPGDQAAMKETWVGLNNSKICEPIAAAFSEAGYPIRLTAGDVSGIAYEGRDQHWPERPSD